MDNRAGLAKILDTGGEIGGPNAIVDGNLLHAPARWLPSIAARAKQFPDMGQERRLSDAAGDQADMIAAERFRKAVAERAPDIDGIASRQAGEQSRDFADDEIHDVDTDRLAVFAENRVVKRERPA